MFTSNLNPDYVCKNIENVEIKLYHENLYKLIE